VVNKKIEVIFEDARVKYISSCFSFFAKNTDTIEATRGERKKKIHISNETAAIHSMADKQKFLIRAFCPKLHF